MFSRSVAIFCACLLAAMAALTAGTLIAVSDIAGDLSAAGARLATHSIWLIPLPALLIAVGFVSLWRFSRGERQLSAQLRGVLRASRRNELCLLPIAENTAVFRGWNRLVDSISATQLQDGLQQRLATALEGFRQRRGEQILNSLAEGLAVTDEAGRITFANETLRALLEGRRESEGDLCTLMNIDGGEGQAGKLFDRQALGRPVTADVPRKSAAGESVLRIARQPLRNSQGESTGSHVWLIRDVTQHALAERMRNEFVNSATHELRTPMANIQAFAETMADALLEEDDLDVERQKEFCNIINSEVNRLSRLIDDMLNIESMAVGSMSLDAQETNFERLLLDTMSKVKPLMEQKDQIFETKLPPKLPTLHIDKDKIALTLVNLLGNASKYTPEGGRVTLRIELRESDVLIHITDTGIGIEKDELAHVFERFYRSRDPRVRAQTGTGLGLALAYEIVRLHGGRLTAESEPEKGSTFTITLPLAVATH
jgi:two-component system phosphate regulon sensor histidine kinase PhoR